MSNKKFYLLLSGVVIAALVVGVFIVGGLDLSHYKSLFVKKVPVLNKFIDENPEESALRTNSKCNDSNRENKDTNKENCYYKEFQNISRDNGHEYAFIVLNALQKIDPDAVGCHLISHGVGSGAYERSPKDWQNLINSIAPICNYGAIHGVMEKYIGSLPEKSFTKELLPTFCGPQPRADCNHILGHLVLVETKADVPAALDMCQIFKNNEAQLEFCNTGVFMEFQTALNLIDHNLAPRSWLDWPSRVSELEKMCRSYKDSEAVACWKEIIHAALIKFNNEPQKIFDFCNTAQIHRGAVECKYHSIGVMAATKNFNLPQLSDMCLIPQKNQPDFQENCYVQLVASTLSTIPQDKSRVEQFCETLTGNYRSKCLAQISDTLYYMKQND